MTRNKILSLLELVVVSVLLAGYFFFLLQHRTFFPSPNPDVFQYLYHAQAYLSGVLPCDQQVPPFYPVVLGIVFWVSSLWFQYSGIDVAIFLNTVSIVGSLFILWLLSKRFLGSFLRIPLIFFLIMHPLLTYGAVNTTPEPVLLFFTLLSFYFFQTKKNIAFCCALLASMVKVEGFVLIGVYIGVTTLPFLQELINKPFVTLTQIWNRKRFAQVSQFCRQYFGFFLMVGVASLWSVWSVLFSFLLKTNQETNNYLAEIITRRSDVPEWKMLIHLFRVLVADAQSFFDLNPGEYYVFSGTIFVLFCIAIAIFLQKQKERTLLLSIFGYLFGYLCLHLFFPAYSIRYFLPLFPLLVLLIFTLFSTFISYLKKAASRYIAGIIWGCFLFFILHWAADQYHHNFWSFLDADRLVSSEQKWVAGWANSNTSAQLSLYFVSLPWLGNDYVTQLNHPTFQSYDSSAPRFCAPHLMFPIQYNPQHHIYFSQPLPNPHLQCTSYTCIRDHILPGAEIFLVNTTDDAPTLIQEREPNSNSPRQEYVNNCLEHLWGKWEGIHFAQIFRLKETCTDL